MYVDMLSKSLVVSRWSSADPRKGWSSSAMRAGSIRLPIVDGGGGFRESAWKLGGKGGKDLGPHSFAKNER
jgi:hypothetical protein